MKRLYLMICVCGLILSGVGTAVANTWQVVYETDFSSDPGWVTNSPSQMYWDQQKAKYHFQLTGSGEYTFVPITYSPDLSYKFEFDIELVRLNYASGISFGLGDPDMREDEPVQWWVNYARGDRGNGATLGYHGDSSSGYFPPPYAFLYEVNTVYHNVIVYDATAQKLTWQVTRISDGIVVADYSSPTGIGTFTGIDRICAKISPGANTSEGYINNVVLSVSEPAGPVAYWSFDNPLDPGHDDSGNGNDGVVYGPTLCEDRCGNPDSAYYFDGMDDYIQVPGAPLNLGTSDVTLSAWVRVDDPAPRAAAIVTKRNEAVATSAGYDLVTTSDWSAGGSIVATIGDGSGVKAAYYNASIINDGQWHLVTAVSDRDGYGRMYVDGVADGEPVPLSGRAGSMDNGYDVLIGKTIASFGEPGYFLGAIDEVRIYNRTLSQAEVMELAGIPEPEPLTGRIAFVSPHPDEGGRLWVMDASEGLSSKVEVTLPLNLWHVGCPEWSREGDWITFHAARSGEIRAGIYVVKPDGSGFCKVNPEGMDIGHPSFSPDGSQIVACTSSYGLYIFTKVGECDWLTEYLTHGVHPRWSPDGDKIAYSNWGQTYNSDIFVYDLNTNTSTQITNHGPGRAFIHAIWSPDGTKLAVVELDHNTDEQDIWIMGMDGLNPVNITESWATSAEVSPSWSPNGEYIVFQSDKSGNLDIWYTPVGHFAPTNITNSPEDEFYPAIGVTEPAEPNIAVSPLSHDFSDVELGTSSTVVVTISNVGDGNLTVSGIALETDFAITSAPPAAAIVVQPGATEDVEITYTPTVLGYNSAVLKITSNDPDEPVVEVQLSAVAIEIPLPPSEQISNILAFFDTSVDDGSLVGDGPGSSAEKRLNTLRNMVEAAGSLIDDELSEEACQQLLDVYRRMDGQPKPPDFVTGEAVPELATMIQELMTTLGCK